MPSAAAAFALLALRAAAVRANTFVTAPSPWHDPEESPFPPTIGPGASPPPHPTSTPTGVLTIETIDPSPSAPSTSIPLPLYPTFPGYRPGGCACYTHTTTVPNPTCAPSSSTCGPAPDCIIDFFETLPPADPACPVTPTVTRTATACPGYCRTGCASGTSTGTGCRAHTTTVSPTIACPAAPVCPPPKCFAKTFTTVEPSYCGCRNAPTSTVTAPASKVCTTKCPTGCLDMVVTVTSSLA